VKSWLVKELLFSSCCEKLVAEAGDISGTLRKVNVSRWSRYQATASGDCNKLRTLLCVWQWFVKCSYESCVKRVQQILLPLQIKSIVTQSRDSFSMLIDALCEQQLMFAILWMYVVGCWHGVCAYINKRKMFTGESRKNKTHTQTTIMSETKKNYVFSEW
jgi:hypothetical protein